MKTSHGWGKITINLGTLQYAFFGQFRSQVAGRWL